MNMTHEPVRSCFMTPSELYLSRCRVNRRLPKPRPGADRPIRAPARARALVARSYGPAVRSSYSVHGRSRTMDKVSSMFIHGTLSSQAR